MTINRSYLCEAGITGVTSPYTLASDREGNTIKVKIRCTDDATNRGSVSSYATATAPAVATSGGRPAERPRSRCGRRPRLGRLQGLDWRKHGDRVRTRGLSSQLVSVP